MSIIKSVRIEKFRGFHNIDISLDANVVAITGQNGTQKTTLLGMLAQPFSLKNHKGKMFGAKTVDGFDFGSQLRDKFKFSPEFDSVGSHAWTLILDENACGRANFSCVSIARKGRTGVGIRFWSSDKSRKKGTGYIQTPVIFLSLKRLLPIGELPKVSVGASGLSEEEQKLYKDWHNQILCSQSQIREVHMLSGAGKSSLAPKTEYSDGVTISSGQDDIGKFILSILSFRRLTKQYPLDYKGGIMFIDELDATLYPAAQIQLLKAMFKFASEYKIQFFFTTHSEAILRYLKIGPYPRQSSIVFLQKLDNAIKAYTDRTLPQIENNLFLNTFEGRVSSPAKVRMYAEDEIAFIFIKTGWLIDGPCRL